MITEKPFIGVEVEGSKIGEDSIFIPCNSIKSITYFKDILTKYNFIKRLYFGAGEQFGLSVIEQGCIRYLMNNSLVSQYKLVLEINSMEQIEEIGDDILSVVDVVYVASTAKNDGRYNRNKAQWIKTVKLVDNIDVFWFDIDKLFISSVSDPLYYRDKEIE